MKELWNYSVRKVYSEDEEFLYQGCNVDMVFEYDFLVTEDHEIYFIIIIKGYEFAINIGGPSMDWYLVWLSEYKDVSPLYRPSKVWLDAPLRNFDESSPNIY